MNRAVNDKNSTTLGRNSINDASAQIGALIEYQQQEETSHNNLEKYISFILMIIILIIEQKADPLVIISEDMEAKRCGRQRREIG